MIASLPTTKDEKMDIKYKIKSKVVDDEHGFVLFKLGIIQSSMPRKVTAELPIIFNTLLSAPYHGPVTHKGFIYTFGDFVFGR